MGSREWHWQERGKAWYGVGIYHVTMVVPSREPLLGRLEIPEQDPKKAYVERTELGNALVRELYVMSKHYPDIRILQYCLMPDHLHAIIHVTREMDTSIRSVLRGFWQGAKRLGRAYILSLDTELYSEHPNTAAPFPIFTEQPFIRALTHQGQLQTMYDYIRINPQRLATKRVFQELFYVQEDIEISGRKYKGVGNAELLLRARYMPVHVRRTMMDDAEKHGDDSALREYMNNCVIAARQGMVMVSPFISKYEKAILDVLLREELPFIYIADNGFGDYYKPHGKLFDAVANKRAMILSPWEYNADKKKVSRDECVMMNKMAEEIAG